MISCAFRTTDNVRFAEARSRFDQPVEHCFKIESGAADHLEHVGGGSLLPQRLGKVLLRLGEFAGSLLELLLQVGCRGAATARSRCVLAALNLRPPP
jgi:hypothetical protein